MGGFQGWWGVRSLLLSREARLMELDCSMRLRNMSAAEELAVISLVSCASLALAWVQEADYFAIFFAIAAVISGEEAIRRSLR